MTPSVFISYSSKNIEVARRVRHGLKNAGITCWMDSADIAPGTHWDRQIHRALQESTHLVYIHTQAGFDSENVWDELSYFRNRDKSIIPLIFEDGVELPYRLERLHYVDFVNQDFETALKLLVRALIGVPTPDPTRPNKKLRLNPNLEILSKDGHDIKAQIDDDDIRQHGGDVIIRPDAYTYRDPGEQWPSLITNIAHKLPSSMLVFYLTILNFLVTREQTTTARSTQHANTTTFPLHKFTPMLSTRTDYLRDFVEALKQGDTEAWEILNGNVRRKATHTPTATPTSTETTYLDNNQFNGAIPNRLGNSRNLYLGGNNLAGAIPPEQGHRSSRSVDNRDIIQLANTIVDDAFQHDRLILPLRDLSRQSMRDGKVSLIWQATYGNGYNDPESTQPTSYDDNKIRNQSTQNPDDSLNPYGRIDW